MCFTLHAWLYCCDYSTGRFCVSLLAFFTYSNIMLNILNLHLLEKHKNSPFPQEGCFILCLLFWKNSTNTMLCRIMDQSPTGLNFHIHSIQGFIHQRVGFIPHGKYPSVCILFLFFCHSETISKAKTYSCPNDILRDNERSKQVYIWSQCLVHLDFKLPSIAAR